MVSPLESAISKTVDASGRRWTPESYVLVAFSGVVLLILVLAGFAGRAFSRSVSSEARVEHTYMVLSTLQRVVADLAAVRTSGQAYVITGDAGYLAQRERAVAAVTSSTHALRELVADNPQQAERAAQLDRANSAVIERMTMVIARRQADGFDAAEAAYAAEVNQALTAPIERLQQAMVGEEARLLDGRLREEAAGRRQAGLVIAALAAVVIATVLIGFEALRREIKRRRRLGAAHEAHEHFLASILDHLPLLVWIKDPNSLRIVTLNRAMERWFGRSRDEVIGRGTDELFPPGDARASIALDRLALGTSDVVTAPVDTRMTPNGGPVTLFMRKVAVRDQNGGAQCILCIAEDISEKLADERRIRELNATLERQKSELEAANRELESFSYSVSHDLRSPLRAIDGFSLMLVEDYGSVMDAEARRYLATIREGTRRMGQLIDDLLAFARVGRQPLQKSSVDMTSLAQDAVADALRDHHGPAPRILIEALPSALGDGSLLKQAWLNLIGNAIKYSSKVEAPVVEVKAYTVGDEVVYSVSDNGAGFDMQFAHKLFKVFQRLHGQAEFSGTGVGLAIVHRIVTRHGGRIWGQSAPGRGATFHFTVTGAPMP